MFLLEWELNGLTGVRRRPSLSVFLASGLFFLGGCAVVPPPEIGTANPANAASERGPASMPAMLDSYKSAAELVAQSGKPGTSEDMGQTMPGMNGGQMPGMGRGMGQGQGMGQGMGPGTGQGMRPGTGQGMGPGMGQGMGDGMMPGTGGGSTDGTEGAPKTKPGDQDQAVPNDDKNSGQHEENHE